MLQLAVILLSVTVCTAAEPAARITLIEGTASILRQGAAEWANARPNMPLSIGDELFCRTESFVEIRYAMGTVVRMNENTKIVVREATGDAVKTDNPIGGVWVNMKKLTGKSKSFEMTSPTAVASIRGTVFQMTTGADSTTAVDVFDGKVAVGPSDELNKMLQAAKPPSPPGESGEVPGPEEVPGPYEVPLEQWTMIVAGQRISVKKNGTYAQDQFDMKTAGQDSFVKKNQELDKKAAAQ